jgi:hypothetical protein
MKVMFLPDRGRPARLMFMNLSGRDARGSARQ